MTKDQREELWAAINHYAVSCGGSPATRVYGNETRQRAVTRIERVVNAIELTWMGPIRCAECGGTDDAPLKVGCSGVIHDNEASEISLRPAATRNVAPEQNQAVTDTEPGQGKSDRAPGKSAGRAAR